MLVVAAGCVSPCGVGLKAFWDGLLTQGSPLSRAAWAAGDGPLVGAVREELGAGATRAESLALAAAQEALAHPVEVLADCGLVYATDGGRWNEPDDGRDVDRLADALGLRGPRLAVRNDCCSALAALTLARVWLSQGRTSAVLVVATSSLIDSDAWHVLAKAGVITRGSTPSTPFSAKRAGSVPAEAAGAVLVRAEPVAGSLGRILGIGLTLNAFRLVAPPPDGLAAAQAIREALGDVRPREVEAVIAHGTATLANDAVEVTALRSVFGEMRDGPWITALKARIGHSFASSGLLGVLAGLCAIAARQLPGCGTRAPDPALPPLRLVADPSPISGERPILVLAHGLGVMNGGLLLASEGAPCP